MLAGLALKWRWRARRSAAGLPADRPNLVLGTNVQVVWEKFCRYWDVEARYVPITPERLHHHVHAHHDDTARRGDLATVGHPVAAEVSERVAKAGPFRLLSDGSDIPVFAFTQG